MHNAVKSTEYLLQRGVELRTSYATVGLITTRVQALSRHLSLMFTKDRETIYGLLVWLALRSPDGLLDWLARVRMGKFYLSICPATGLCKLHVIQQLPLPEIR